MKKKLLILIACIVLVATVLSLVACSENTKQEPIPTDLNGAKVSDNGGMAVKYGNYIYFINGFAGETALNTYGDVVRGAICRTTLNSNGEPDYKSVKTIVSKNAFGEDKTYGGIYIVNDYIYYKTPEHEPKAKQTMSTGLLNLIGNFLSIAPQRASYTPRQLTEMDKWEKERLEQILGKKISTEAFVCYCTKEEYEQQSGLSLKM